MSSSLKCPFCNSALRKSEGFVDRRNNIRPSWDHYFCDESICMNDDMTRYSVNYSCNTDKNRQPIKKMSCSFMIDIFYIQIDWSENISILSTLDGALLVGSITLPQALDLDLSDLQSTINKIKTLLIFF